MKNFTYLIATIFFFETATSTMAWAESSQEITTSAVSQELDPADYGLSNTISKERFAEIMKMREEKPYSSLFVPESACAGKEKELQGFVNEVATTDGSGNATANKYQGKLNEKENELGDRNFDFEKMISSRFNSQNDDKTNVCLDTFMDMAMMEWVDYFENQSKEFECGLVFEVKDEYQTIVDVAEEPGKRKDTCDIPYANEKLYDFYKKQMEKLKDIRNEYYAKRKDELKKKREGQADPSKTQAGVGCTGPDCSPSSAEAKNAKSIEKFSSEWCCERISERFEVLGFTTVKDVKPNERVCNELTNKDTDTGYCEGSFCTKTIGDCLKNFASVFLRDFFSSLVNSFDILGWGSQLMTMVKEIISDPYEAGKNIVKNMFGFDGDYMGCLNKKSQSQYVCQMIGKFAGSSAGFSAGLGGIIGLARGTFKGVAGKMAKDPGAKIIKPALKDAVKTGAKAAAVGTVWPYYAARGAIKGTASVIKGTWKNTPHYAGKVARATISAVPELAGRSANVVGKWAVRRGSDDAVKVGEALQNAGARRVQRAQEIRSSGGSRPTPAATQAAAKYDVVIGQAEAAVKSIDDQIGALQKQRNTYLEGKTITNGKPKLDAKSQEGYFEATRKIDELKKQKTKAETELDELKKAKETELNKIGDAAAKAGANSRNNVKGTVLGVGAAGSQYPANGKQPAKTGNTTGSGAKDDVPAAAPVQGVGTGDGVPKPKPAEPAAAPAPAAPPAAGESGPGPLPPM